MHYRRLFLFLFACSFVTLGRAQVTEIEPPNPLYESVIVPDRSLARRLEQADRLFEAGRSAEAAQLLGGVLENANFAFLVPENSEDEPIRTLRQTVNDDIIDRIRKLPKEARESYTFQFEPTARRLLENAVAAGSMDDIQQVARKYFPTASGASAAFLVGVSQFERGDYAAAFLTLERLKRNHPSIPDTISPALEQMLEEVQGKISDVARQRAAGISEAAWLEQIGWRIPAGSPSQNAETKATAPLLEKNWTVPVFNRLDRERETDLLTRTIRGGNDVYIPASQPLVAGNLFVTRTLGETIAVDMNSGKRLWIAPDPEYRFPGGSGIPPLPRNVSLRLFHWHDRISHQLSSDGERLFSIDEHDLQGSYQTQGPFGRVAVVPNLGGRGEDLRYGPGNTLTARDLKTGRMLWQVGKFPYVQKYFEVIAQRPPAGRAGSAQNQAVQANVDENIFIDDEKILYETWFLGAPLPLQGRLYVIGETDGLLQLFVLESQTGRLIARQAFAQAPASLAASVVRRTYPLFPSASGGLVFCPSGNGLITALDATTLAPVWCYSYASAQAQTSSQANRNPMFRPQNLQPPIFRPGASEQSIKHFFNESGWQVPSMIIDGERLLAAPPDQAVLFALDLLTGKFLWSQNVSRPNTLYVACVQNDKAFLVTPRNLLVIDMNTGRELSLPGREFPPELKPAGVGVRSGNQYFIPFTDGHLAVVDLNDVKLTWLSAHASGSASLLPTGESLDTESTEISPDEVSELHFLENAFSTDLIADSIFRQPIQWGNLVGIKGGFFSQSPTQISSFDQKEPLRQRAEALLLDDANDPEGLLQQGRILKSEGKFAGAIDAFRASLRAKPTPEAADLLRKNLLEAVRQDYSTWSHARQELESLAEFPVEWGAILYAQFEGIFQSGRTEDLAAVLEKVFAADQEPAVLIPVSGDHSAQLRQALGSLAEQNTARGNLKAMWEELAETFFQQLAGQQWSGQQLGWYSESPEIQRWSMFASIFRHTFAAEKAKHILRNEYERHRLPLALNLREQPSAILEWSELPSPFVWKPGKMEALIDPAPPSNNLPNLPPVQRGAEQSEMEREIDRHVNRLLAIARNPGMPRIGDNPPTIPLFGTFDSEPPPYNYLVKPGTAGQFFFCRVDLSGQELWRLALPSAIVSGYQEILQYRSGEHMTYVKEARNFLLFVHGTSMTAIDTTPQAEKILWSKTLSSWLIHQQSGTRIANSNQRPNLMASFPKSTVFISPNAICYWDANCVYGLDPMTGQTLWVRKVPYENCTIAGDDENLFLVFPDIQQVVAIDPASGGELASGHLYPGGIHLYGTNIVFMQRRGSDHILTVCDLRDIHDKRRRALLVSRSPGGSLTSPIPRETLHDGITNTSMLQTFRNGRFISIAEWNTRSLQIYDLLTKKKLLPDANRLLDFVTPENVSATLTRCDVELVGDRILVLFTKDTAVRNRQEPFEEDGAMRRRQFRQVTGISSLGIDRGEMMMFDSEGNPDPHWKEPVKLEKTYRLLDVPARLPFMLFAVVHQDTLTSLGRSIPASVIIQGVDKRSGEVRFSKRFATEHIPMQSFRVSADMEAQELIFSVLSTSAAPRTVKMVVMPE